MTFAASPSTQELLSTGILLVCHIEFKFCDQKINIILVFLHFMVPGDGRLAGIYVQSLRSVFCKILCNI